MEQIDAAGFFEDFRQAFAVARDVQFPVFSTHRPPKCRSSVRGLRDETAENRSNTIFPAIGFERFQNRFGTKARSDSGFDHRFGWQAARHEIQQRVVASALAQIEVERLELFFGVSFHPLGKLLAFRPQRGVEPVGQRRVIFHVLLAPREALRFGLGTDWPSTRILTLRANSKA